MKKYAQEDTHYLLYIYDRMKAQAIAKGNETNNLLMTILNRSRDLCLTVYDKVFHFLLLQSVVSLLLIL